MLLYFLLPENWLIILKKLVCERRWKEIFCEFAFPRSCYTTAQCCIVYIPLTIMATLYSIIHSFWFTAEDPSGTIGKRWTKTDAHGTKFSDNLLLCCYLQYVGYLWISLLLPYYFVGDNTTKVSFKADFQSVLRTLESLFTTFVLFHVRRHKM